MVIACNRCHTKFSIDNNLVAAGTKKRFHCSRCGNLFEHEVKAAEVSAPVPEQVRQVAPEISAQETQTNNWSSVIKRFSKNERSPKQLDLLPSERKESSKSNNLNSRTREKENLSYGYSWTVGKGIPENAIAEWPDASEQIAAPVIPIQNKIVKNESLELDPEYIEREISKWPEYEDEWDDKADLNSQSFSIGHHYAPDSVADTPDELIKLAEKRKKAKNTGLKRLSVVFAIPIVFCSAFFCVSDILPDLDVLASGILKQKDSAQLIPPGGIELVNTKQNNVTLDNGTAVIEISGQILNGTNANYQNVMIEISSYDEDNQLLDSVIVPSSNDLIEAKLPALSVEELVELQTSSPTEVYGIKSGETLPFRAVLTKGTDKASWYSTRVYSVNKES
jgi:predicted Zn finger-like uncharacterized protein